MRMQFFTLLYKDILLFNYAILWNLFCFVHSERVWLLFYFAFLLPIFFLLLFIWIFFFFLEKEISFKILAINEKSRSVNEEWARQPTKFHWQSL